MEILNISINSNSFPIISKFRKGDQKILNIYEIIYYDQYIFCYIAKLKKDKFIDDQLEIINQGEKVMKKYGILFFEILKFDIRNKSYWIFIKQKMPKVASKILKKFKGDLFLIPPLIVSEEKFQIQALINESKLEEFQIFMKENNIEYQWIKKKKFNISHNSIDKEGLNLISLAYNMGYFDNPKRINLEELGEIWGTTKSSIARRLRKYEKIIINYFLNGNII